MKANKGFMQMLLVGAFAFFILSISGCSEKEYDGVNAQAVQSTQKQILNRVRNMTFKLKTADGGTVLVTGNGGMSANMSFSSGSNSSTFTDIGGSTSFAADQGSVSYSSGASNNSSYDLGGTLNAGGGSFIVNGKSVSLDYVFCAEEDSIFGDLSGFSGDEIKVLVGISGEFESPEDARLDYMVFMIMFSDGTTGSYKLDFDLLLGEEPEGKFGLIEIIDFSKLKQDGSFENIEDAKLYVSVKGTLDATNGAYVYSNADFAEITFDQGGEFSMGKKVKGSGNLLCQ